ncbi:MAG TPA: hypothetical protein VMG13_03975, partial [Trebonia sp.]|nr:hypothetical protein [Trebonia sp.]
MEALPAAAQPPAEELAPSQPPAEAFAPSAPLPVAEPSPLPEAQPSEERPSSVEAIPFEEAQPPVEFEEARPPVEEVPSAELLPPAEVLPLTEAAPPVEAPQPVELLAPAEEPVLAEAAPAVEQVPAAGALPPVEPLPPAAAPPPVEPPPPAPPMPVVKAVTDSEHPTVQSIERALSGPAKHRDLSWHAPVKIVAGATQGPGKRDQEALDRARARLPLKTPKRVLMLGCTSGGGQTMTALMTGHILASLREEPVAALDLHDGTLARYSAPAAWLEDVLSGRPPQSASKTRPDGLNPAAKAAPARLDVIASRDPLRDGDEVKLAVQLNRHYSLAVLDPGATGLTKLL